MKVKIFNRLILLLMVLLFAVNPMVVSAAEIDATLQTSKNSAYLSELCTESNASVGETILTYDATSGLLRFSNKTYADLESEDKEEFMETALSYVAGMPDTVSAKMQNSVYNFISQQDTAVTAAMKYLQVNAGADLVEAEKWFDPFNSVIGTILGVICVLIFLFLGLSILFDIFYIVIPPFQAMMDAGNDGNKKPWGVSREAWGSMRDAEKSDVYKNVLSLYFRRRAGILVIVAIAITYLVSGKIYDVVIWLVEAFSW